MKKQERKGIPTMEKIGICGTRVVGKFELRSQLVSDHRFKFIGDEVER